jgi:hypothetical protein
MPRPHEPDLDLSKLYELSVEQPTLVKQASANKVRVKYAGNENRFRRIGFDLFKDNDSEFVWKLEKDSESGEEFITRTAQVYSLYKGTQSWSTEIDSSKNAITLIYKGHALKAFKKADLQFDESNVEDWRKFLVDKISTDPSFLTKVLSGLSEDRKRYLFAKYPELTK